MRTYIPIAEIEARDPAWADRIRKRERIKCARLRERNPERAREYGRAAYARDPEKMRRLTRAWREANPEKVRAMKEIYYREHRAQYIVQAVRGEARQKGVRFNISVGWVQERLDRGVCELSGLPFDLAPGRKNLKDKPSIDRRIPDGDYVENNCRFILFGLNSRLRRQGDAGVPAAVARIRELRAEA